MIQRIAVVPYDLLADKYSAENTQRQQQYKSCHHNKILNDDTLGYAASAADNRGLFFSLQLYNPPPIPFLHTSDAAAAHEAFHAAARYAP